MGMNAGLAAFIAKRKGVAPKGKAPVKGKAKGKKCPTCGQMM